MSKDSPRLDGGLIVRKGEAAPAVVAASPATSTDARTSPPPTVAAPVSVPKGTAGTIAVTVRLDPKRYEELKGHGARHRQTNQQIIVAALDAYFAKGGT